ncbi:MAG: M28 family metallopeptidase [Candidatus Thorarchaeota archaeon]
MSEIESIKKHVKHLSVTIGPRGSTTYGEKRSAEYAEQVYRYLGLSPIVEHFRSAKSAWLPFALATALVLVGEILFLLGGYYGRLLAIIICLFALASLVLELMFKSNPFRWILPKGDSQNVSVKIPPEGSKKDTVILIGHLDTHRMPIVYKSQWWVRFFRSLTTTTFVCAILLLVLYALTLFFDWILFPLLSLVFSIPITILCIIAVSADRTDYTPGANDNATGTAIVMGLAERALKAPLQNIELWAINSGCEEVGAYGAEAWINQHIHEVERAIFLTIDNVGGRGTSPCYLTKETLIFPFESDSTLLALADLIASENPELAACSHEMKAAYTEGAIGIKAGLRCLTFVNYTPEGTIPDWHQPSDLFENVDWDVVQRTEEFVWRLIQKVDSDI